AIFRYDSFYATYTHGAYQHLMTAHEGGNQWHGPLLTPKRKPPAVPGDSQSLTVPGVGRKTPSGEPLNVQPRGS
ncbi:MAG TPA: hypothetical protein VH681_05745, partial [Nitrospiraceae bacterium]